ncbi:hypothetical protein [Kitasatospora sp. NPDC006786]|uniref:hypothetical protein n=1 Tax=unclassified Kitasatospora TaxID=2633591 RepID=UPI003400D82C
MAWEGQGFAPVAPDELHYQDTGARRSSFQSYAQAVDWRDRGHVERALLVFEELMRVARRDEWQGKWLEDLTVPLERSTATSPTTPPAPSVAPSS